MSNWNISKIGFFLTRKIKYSYLLIILKKIFAISFTFITVGQCWPVKAEMQEVLRIAAKKQNREYELRNKYCTMVPVTVLWVHILTLQPTQRNSRSKIQMRNMQGFVIVRHSKQLRSKILHLQFSKIKILRIIYYPIIDPDSL